MAEELKGTAVVQAGNTVQIGVAGELLALAEAKGGIKFWPEKQASHVGETPLLKPQYWLFQFDNEADAAKFALDAEAQIATAKTALDWVDPI